MLKKVISVMLAALFIFSCNMGPDSPENDDSTKTTGLHIIPCVDSILLIHRKCPNAYNHVSLDRFLTTGNEP